MHEKRTKLSKFNEDTSKFKLINKKNTKILLENWKEFF